MRRLHFVNRVDFRNAGDFSCGLSGYLPFGGLKPMHHDIDNVAWNFIRRTDAVIIGASGMLNVTESFNRNIIRLLDMCDTVIGYGIGFNKTPGQEPSTDIVPHLNRFKLLGVRDFDNPHGIRYLPCPSVKLLEGLEPREVRREVGVIHHRDYRLGQSGWESIDNSRSIWEVLDFILESETVITSSYHCAYWSQLLGKKVVIDRMFSEKFDYFRHKPVVGIANIAQAKPVPVEFMAECIRLNKEFYLEVCDLLSASPYMGGHNNSDIEARLANLAWRVATLEGRV